jgi:hypothetical protein
MGAACPDRISSTDVGIANTVRDRARPHKSQSSRLRIA